MLAYTSFRFHGYCMQIEFAPAVIKACSDFVVTLDQHLAGAAALIAVLLACGAAVALAKWRRK